MVVIKLCKTIVRLVYIKKKFQDNFVLASIRIRKVNRW